MSLIKTYVSGLGNATALEFDSNHCFPLALAATAKLAYDDAYKFCKEKLQRKHGKGVQVAQIVEAFKEGKVIDVIVAPVSNQREYSYKSGKPSIFCASKLGNFAKEHPEGNFICIINSHAVAIVAGEIMDGTSPNSIVKYAYQIGA
jgi:hypothetical protein